MFSIRKILQIKFFREYIFSFLLLYTIILNGKEFFHNHEFSLIEPENCPVYILSINSESYSVDATSFEFIIPIQNFILLISSLAVSKQKQSILHLRAPPFLF